MKKYIFIIQIICFFFFIPLFGQTVPYTQSAVYTATFGNYSLPYDTFLDEMYWTQSNTGKTSTYTGINTNQLNLGVAVNIFSKWYGAFAYKDIISDYKWWPENMTHESWTGFFAFKNLLSIRVGYLDFCYSEGKGTAMPFLYIGYIHGDSDYKFRFSLGTDLAFRYSSGSNNDVIQPITTVSFDYSKNKNSGFGLKYLFTPTFKGKDNITNVNDIPLCSNISVWYGNTWDI